MVVVYFVASGDSRLPANQVCWPAQAAMEERLTKAFADLGVSVIRAHPYEAEQRHGFICTQRMGMDVFRKIPAGAPVVVAEAVWQYSYFVLPGLRTHTGPILTVANWSGRWPGLVGMLNLNASLTKIGRAYSTLWSETFTDTFFTDGLAAWLESGVVAHPTPHVRPLEPGAAPPESVALGRRLGAAFLERKAIMGIFDEGCMGMVNACFDDELLADVGIYKERLSQSALYAAMQVVPDSEAAAALQWLRDAGMRFSFGTDSATCLTEDQVLEQMKMYIAAVRLADSFSCDCIGIQGLKDLCAASDLAEGILNNSERPPVRDAAGRVLFEGRPVPHFNEVDQGAAVDALVTAAVWPALGLDPAATLHDIRWGENFQLAGGEAFVWVFEISGSVPPAHIQGGYKGCVSERQPSMYFPRGGGTIKGVSRPGVVVWSRVFQAAGALHADLGIADVVVLPEAETQRRWEETTPQWPMMHAVLRGVSRNQMMARHKSNHIYVAYADGAAGAALATKAAMFAHLGLHVNLCGVNETGIAM